MKVIVYNKEWRSEEEYQAIQEKLNQIEKSLKVKQECLEYEIKHDCFNETRCKALNEQVDYITELLKTIKLKGLNHEK